MRSTLPNMTGTAREPSGGSACDKDECLGCRPLAVLRASFQRVFVHVLLASPLLSAARWRGVRACV
jgi:hypothetical protein